MNDCLKTQLKGTVNNENLPYFGMIKVGAKATGANAGFIISCGWNKKVEIKSSTPFSVWNFNNDTKGTELASNVTYYEWTNNNASFGNAFISVPNDGNTHTYHISKYVISALMQINMLGASLNCNLFVDCEDLEYNENYAYMCFTVNGQINDIPSANIRRLGFIKSGTSAEINSNATGNLTSVFNNNVIRLANVPDNCSMNIDELTGQCGTYLTELYMQNCRNVHGDVWNWCERIFEAGKVSGTISIAGYNSSAKLNGADFPAGMVNITFTAEGPQLS